MQLAKTVIDVGLSTNDLEPMLRFWQQRFDHVLPVWTRSDFVWDVCRKRWCK
jgi:hypothetical protein